MKIFEYFALALNEIWAHKMRSGLTALGVIFGVAAVIAIVSVGEGAKAEAERELSVLGDRSVIVRSEVSVAESRLMERAVNVPGRKEEEVQLPKLLEYEDAVALSRLPGVRYASPSSTLKASVVNEGRIVEGITLIGTDAHYSQIYKLRVLQGRFFNSLEVANFRKVCVMTREVAKKVFGLKKPVGKEIILGGETFTVVGVVEPPTFSGVTILKMRDMSEDLYVPITTASLVLDGKFLNEPVDEIFVEVKGGINPVEFADAIKYRVTKGKDDKKVSVVVPLALIMQKQKIQRIFVMVIGFIAGISLLVGGIGIMNIMLATVSQRVKEVGIRRSIGATRGDILLQFLTESVTVSFAGGVFGVGLGYLISLGISRFAGWEVLFSLHACYIAFLISFVEGVVFGLYPAYEAAKLDPVVALRYE